MNELISRRPLLVVVVLVLAGLACVAFNSCSQTKPQIAGSGAYASYPADGRYNPYPTGSSGATTKPRYQEYTEAPPPPPETKPKPKSKSTGATASVSSSKKPAKKKSTTAAKTTSTKTTSAKSTASGTVHIVKPKDSLYSIAKKYHTTVSKLKSANRLSSDLIRDGQKLKIP